MKSNWSGFTGIELEDFAMSVSQAEWDRSKEHLVTSDLAVVRMRRMLLEAIRRFQTGEPPPAVNVADLTRVVAYDRDLQPTDKWQDFAPGNRQLIAAE